MSNMSKSPFERLDIGKTGVRSTSPLVIEKPRAPLHIHTYGGETEFFKALTQGKLLGGKCTNKKCETSGQDALLPPRVYCPDCLEKMKWVDLTRAAAKIYTHITVEYPGAFNKLPTPCHLISVEVEGTNTVLMSYLVNGKPEIGLKVRPLFNTQSPTYTILDLCWEPVK